MARRNHRSRPGIRTNRRRHDRQVHRGNHRPPSHRTAARLYGDSDLTDQCKHPGCDRDAYRIGYCHAHRNRFRLGKDMDAPIRGTVPAEVLFWAKVRKSPGCWEWTAGRSREGYGNFWFNNTMVRAHRLSFEWSNGPIPDGM